MDCRDIENNLFAYGEGKLSPDNRHALEEHAGKCESCARLLESYRAMESVIKSDRAAEPNPFAATRILQRLENAQQRRSRYATAILRPVLITMALFLAISMGFLIGSLGISRTMADETSDPQMESFKSDLFFTEFVDEDLTKFTDF